jgi:transcriptional regulator with XRE-family HTH domain
MTDDIGARLRKLRLEAGETQVQLAAAIGVSQALVSDIEKGVSKTTSYVAQIADHYAVSALWFATGEGPREVKENARANDVMKLYLSLNPATQESIHNLLINVAKAEK